MIFSSKIYISAQKKHVSMTFLLKKMMKFDFDFSLNLSENHIFPKFEKKHSNIF